MLFKKLFKINLLLKTIICNYLIYIIFNFKCIPHNVGMFLCTERTDRVNGSIPHNVGMFPKVVSSTVEDEGIPHNVGMFLWRTVSMDLIHGIPHNVGMFL